MSDRGRLKKNGSRFSLIAVNEWLSRNGHKLKCRKFHLNIRKLILTARVVNHCLPRENVGNEL